LNTASGEELEVEAVPLMASPTMVGELGAVTTDWFVSFTTATSSFSTSGADALFATWSSSTKVSLLVFRVAS
jgi:hypothetical protein